METKLPIFEMKNVGAGEEVNEKPDDEAIARYLNQKKCKKQRHLRKIRSR